MLELIQMQGMLFLLVAAGIILRRYGVLPDAGKEMLTDLVLCFVLPCNIIHSFRMDFNLDILKSFAVILAISVLIQIGCLLLSSILYRKQPDDRRKVLQYATVVSNAGFLGNPIAEGVYGAEGLMYASIYLLPQRIVMWSAGISYFTESPDFKTLVKKIMMHPCIIAVELGLILMIGQIPLPEFVGNTIRTVGNCTTTLSMVLIGTILAEVDFKTMVSKSLIFYSVVRLFLIPLVVLICCRWFGIDSLLTGVSVLLSGMPAGSTTAILSAKYHGDYVFGTKCVVFTTLLSLITIPLWCLIV